MGKIQSVKIKSVRKRSLNGRVNGWSSVADYQEIVLFTIGVTIGV